MSSWLTENIKYETNITRGDILDEIFCKLLKYLNTTCLIQTCDKNTLRNHFIGFIYEYYTKIARLDVKFDENYDWIDQLYSEELSNLFEEFLNADDFLLTEIFKYRRHDRIVDFVSLHFRYENNECNEYSENDENILYKNIDE